MVSVIACPSIKKGFRSCCNNNGLVYQGPHFTIRPLARLTMNELATIYTGLEEPTWKVSVR